MLSWFAENLPTILVLVVLVTVVALIIVHMVRNRRKGKLSCGCGCQNCPMSGSCHQNKVIVAFTREEKRTRAKHPRPA